MLNSGASAIGGIQNDGLPQGSLRFQRSGSNGKMFGVFRTADLGQQYDTVSRVGGNFSFHSDTFILLCITFDVVRSRSSQVGLPWFIPPRGSLWDVSTRCDGASQVTTHSPPHLLARAADPARLLQLASRY